MKTLIGPVMTGKAVPFDGAERSAIAKYPAAGPLSIGTLGLSGDEQADLSVHGGPDKAVHHYPHDHYPAWREDLDGHQLLDAPGAFGENITTSGVLERDVCIGDRFRLGTALVEISQGRQPCWKIDHKFQRKGVTARVIKTGRCGWYYRVIEPGQVRQGDPFELVERGAGEWSVERTFHLLIAGGHRSDPAAVRALAALESLAPRWRERAAMLDEARN